jgi:hypothetical protein
MGGYSSYDLAEGDENLRGLTADNRSSTTAVEPLLRSTLYVQLSDGVQIPPADR